MLAGFAAAARRRLLCAFRRLARATGRFSGRERATFVRLRAKADEVRAAYIRKPRWSGNVAALEYASLASKQPIQVEATSREASPAPLPVPRSEGGYFEPSVDAPTGWLRATDSEYKALSELARRLDEGGWPKVGVVYLFTEREPCSSCAGVIAQFEERFPLVVVVVESDEDLYRQRGMARP
jgi:filamentous hemagglutinin